MKKTWPILCCILAASLLVSVAWAYRQGVRRGIERRAARTALEDATHGLAILDEFRSNRTDLVIARIERDVWDAVQFIDTYRQHLTDYPYADVDEVLPTIARYFNEHPLMTGSPDDFSVDGRSHEILIETRQVLKNHISKETTPTR
jgi:hypothetical protein